MIRPIETCYHGCRFRSRAEARWAVFFDAAGARWDYEPQGFEVDGVAYLPDFRVWIDGRPLWVEVKGEMTVEDAMKLERFAFEEPILILPPPPKARSIRELDDLTLDMFLHRPQEWVDISPFSILSHVRKIHMVPGVDVKGRLWLFDYSNKSRRDELQTLRAYLEASWARFEHGEKGGPNVPCF